MFKLKKISNFLTGLFIGGIFAWVARGFLKTTQKISSVGKQNKKKVINKGKILDELKKNNKICNDDVQLLLEVSDATAERYLSELEASGMVKQVRKEGRGVYYKLN